jgi:hypothetical protein
MFIAILLLTALSIAGAAAFISVFGLSQIYYGAIFYVTIFAFGALEAGKLVAASALYRYWDTMSKMLRAYMFAAVLTLIAVTSAGIFGFLTAAYQVDNIGLEQQRTTIQLYEDQKFREEARLVRIDEQIAEVPETYVTKRMELIATFEPEKQAILDRITELDQQILDLKTQELTTEAKIGPILYVAEALDQDPDKSLIWFTLIIVLVFDPLAVSLTLMANIAMEKRKSEKNKEKRYIMDDVREEELEIMKHNSETLDEIKESVSRDDPESGLLNRVKNKVKSEKSGARVGKVIDS